MAESLATGKKGGGQKQICLFLAGRSSARPPSEPRGHSVGIVSVRAREWWWFDSLADSHTISSCLMDDRW